MIVVTARYRSEFTPEQYLDFAIDKLSGYIMDAKRTDRMIYCSQDEWLGEEAGVWSYAATFVVPVNFSRRDCDQTGCNKNNKQKWIGAY